MSLAFQPRTMSKMPTPLEELRAKLPALREAIAPEHIILFGSHARGEATEYSDIDVIFVSQRFADTTRPNRHRLIFKHIWRDRSVDAICLTPEEFAKLRKWAGVVNTACEEGIWL